MDKQLTSVIIDDEEIARIALTTLAAGFPFLAAPKCFSNAVEAAEFINRFKPDIVFADIEMPSVSGLQLIRRLGWQPPAVIFVTSHPEFAVDGFEVQAFDYLLKPVSPERFKTCVQRINNFFSMLAKVSTFDNEQESGYIIFKQGYDRIKLRLSEILYIEAMKDYVRIVAKGGNYLVLETLTHFKDRLNMPSFIRIHRSYLVNTEKITAVMGNKIVVGGMELPVGKSFRHSLDNVL